MSTLCVTKQFNFREGERGGGREGRKESKREREVYSTLTKHIHYNNCVHKGEREGGRL